jgi:protein-tyrosine phosphatase
VIDLHCHLLPGVDDGPVDLEGALAMARAHVAVGVRRVAATPHVSWDIPTTAATVSEGVAGLRQALAREAIDLDVVTGAEIAMTRVPELDDDELGGLALNGGPWLLVESPLTPGASGFDQILHHLQVRGHRILLAHPERCPAFQRDPARLTALVHAGMLTSLTAGAFVGRFGTTVQRFSHKLAVEGLVHNVASDAHNTNRRAPGLRAELLEAGYGDHVEWWCESVPAALLSGEPVPAGPPPPRPPQRRRFGGLGRVRAAWSRR